MCAQVTLNSAKAYLSHESPTAHVTVLESMQEMLLQEEMAEWSSSPDSKVWNFSTPR